MTEEMWDDCAIIIAATINTLEEYGTKRLCRMAKMIGETTYHAEKVKSAILSIERAVDELRQLKEEISE